MKKLNEKILGHKNEEGVALITVIILSAVLMVMGAGMYMVASREQTMTAADYAGGEAFYYAEGGIENVLDILNDTATEGQLTQLRADQSSNGYGYLMDPSPGNRQDPTDPVEMRIGQDSYTVYVDTVDVNGNQCSDCGLELFSPDSVPSYLLVTAEGQSSTGYRKLQQMVEVTAVTGPRYPLSLYVDGDADFNGNPEATNQIFYVKGNVKGRAKLGVSGTDFITGSPAAVYATGTITGIQPQDRDKSNPVGNPFTLAELQSIVGTATMDCSSARVKGFPTGLLLSLSCGCMPVIVPVA